MHYVEFRDFCANKVFRKHHEREEYYFGEWEGGFRKGLALVYAANQYLYYGQVDRVPHGTGLLKLYPQNIEIEGEMRAGRPDGECTIRDLGGVYNFKGLIRDQAPISGRFEVFNHTVPDKSY